MGEFNRGPAEQSEAKSNIAVAERGDHDGLQQFRLAASDDKSAGGGPGASGQDRLPPLSIDKSKYGAALPDTLPPLRNCPSYEPGVFGAELVPECRIYPPIEDSKPASEKDADVQQIKAEDQPGAAREINPIKQQIMDENQLGAAKVDLIKQQIMAENQPGAAPRFDADRYQIMIENQPGAALDANSIKQQIMDGKLQGAYIVDPIKEQIRAESQPGAADKFSGAKYQAVLEYHPGSAPQQNRVGRSIDGAGSW